MELEQEVFYIQDIKRVERIQKTSNKTSNYGILNLPYFTLHSEEGDPAIPPCFVSFFSNPYSSFENFQFLIHLVYEGFLQSSHDLLEMHFISYS